METVHLTDRRVDLARGRVHKGGEEIRLTTQEVALLRILVERGTVAATELFAVVWGPRAPFDNRKLSNAVGRLRKKIEADPGDPSHVLTDFGSGYRFVAASEPRVLEPPVRARARPTATLVGRIAELEGIDRAIDRGASAVTIIGPPGVGKTELGRAWAARRDVPWISVSGGDVASSVAAALGLASGMDDEATWREVGRHTDVVVLDDLDGVPEPWLTVGPQIVVTSLRVLGLDGEHVIALGPLPDGEAEELFVHYASRVRADGGWQPFTKAIVRATGGLPLAIVLAVGRLRVLSPQELVARLEREGGDVELWGSGAHAHVRAAWSVLDPDLDGLAAKLGLLPGPFRASLVEEAWGPEVIDRLARLRDRSIVHAEPDGELAMSPPIRRYALERARELGIEATAGDELDRALMRATESLRTSMVTDGDAHASPILALLPLLQARLAATRLPAAATRYAMSLADVGFLTAWLSPRAVDAALERGLTVMGDAHPEDAIRLLKRRGIVSQRLDRMELAESYYRRADELAAPMGGVWSSRTCSALASILSDREAMDEALVVARRAVALTPEDAPAEAHVLNQAMLAGVLSTVGHIAESVALYRELAFRAQGAGLERLSTNLSVFEATSTLLAGDARRTIQLLDAAEAHHAQFEPRTRTELCGTRAVAWLHLGELDLVDDPLTEAEALVARSGWVRSSADIVITRALWAFAQGDPKRGAQVLADPTVLRRPSIRRQASLVATVCLARSGDAVAARSMTRRIDPPPVDTGWTELLTWAVEGGDVPQSAWRPAQLLVEVLARFGA